MRELTRRREPTTPGKILRAEFLIPLSMTQKQLADHLGCDVKVINRIVNGRSSVTAEMALKLGATFRISPEFWLNAQKAVDLHQAARHLSNPAEATASSRLTCIRIRSADHASARRVPAASIAFACFGPRRFRRAEGRSPHGHRCRRAGPISLVLGKGGGRCIDVPPLVRRNGERRQGTCHPVRSAG